MKVYFIGAGPGAADLITVRGQNLVKKCPICIYAGSLVPKEIIAKAPKNALIIDSSSLNLDEIIAIMKEAQSEGKNVARLHSGDCSIYGAIGEQIREITRLGIDYEIVPGVPSFAGAAARLGLELTLPNIAQTIILTRTSGKASKMPASEQLEILAQSKATLAIHLSIRNLDYIKQALIPHYGADCPVIIAHRATWSDEKYIRTNLANMKQDVRKAKITRTALIFVGGVLAKNNFANSALYDASFSHIMRNEGKKKNMPN